jgi:uncharacterized protein (DUF1015 family)
VPASASSRRADDPNFCSRESVRIHPFDALRPAPELAAQVAAVPYDVVSRAEAVELAADNPNSFLHVGRSDIDLPADTDPHDDRVYTRSREALDELLSRRVLIREGAGALYLYRQIMHGRVQTGLVGCVHIDDYEGDVIRKHEKTRQDKEDDRTRHVLTLAAHAEPVFLAHRGVRPIEALSESVIETKPLYDFTAPDQVRHTVWRIPDPAPWVEAFKAVPHAYVADGHHRSASAWRAGQERRSANPKHQGNEEYNWFLAVLFPAEQLTILPYNRLVRDLGGKTSTEVIEALRSVGRVTSTRDSRPQKPGTFCVYLAGGWLRVELDESSIDRRDPIASLDVSLLQDRVLTPILGVGDPRHDKRLEFVGGIRGTSELERRVDSGEMAIAFSLYPTTMDQLMAVSDAGTVMPPKSTWFEPKLRSGLFVHTF